MKYAVLNEAGDDHDEPEAKTPVVKKEEPKTLSGRVRKQKRGNVRKKWKQKTAMVRREAMKHRKRHKKPRPVKIGSITFPPDADPVLRAPLEVERGEDKDKDEVEGEGA